MGLISNLFDKHDSTPALDTAVEHAVSAVDPLLLQTSGYPERYRQPVQVALEYARQLADSLPGPVQIDRKAYAQDAFVHILFPDIEAIPNAIISSLSMQEYLRHPPSGNEFYALMGMRRVDKKILGMQLAGEIRQQDVAQQATYFVSHTLESPAPNEALTREKAATQFFHRLVGKVKARIEQRKQNKETLIAKKDSLTARLHSTSSNTDRSALEQRLAVVDEGLESIILSLDPGRYTEDFEAVLLHPAEHLHLARTPITLDSMGIRHMADDGERVQEFVFSELIGYDQRNWTVTLVRCVNVEYETFAERLDKAYRSLSL